MSKEQEKGLPPCEPISTNDASVNWAVFGRVKEVKNCPGRGAYQERITLTNGWGIYQEANWDYGYFVEPDENTFREGLALTTYFADTTTTMKIHTPKIRNYKVFVIFAQKMVAGKNHILFEMSSSPGHGDGTEWGKVNKGSIYDDSNMSEDEFREFFLKRIRVFDTSAAESFIASRQAKKGGVKNSGVKASTYSAPSTKTKASQPATDANIKNRLRELKKLVGEGLITPDEAVAKRKKILNSL